MSRQYGVHMEIRIAQPQLGLEEIEAVSRVISSGMIAHGPETRAFEKEFAEFIGCRYACAVNNGTAALSLSLSALGIRPGDEVITTPFTFVATANAILSCGAIPVFADIDEDTFNLSPQSVESVISEKTKAIMPVHLYGHPADMLKFEALSKKYNVKLIGDAAQAHGASISGKAIGQFGDVECFSFYPTKNMTTGEGGMVVTNDENLFRQLQSIRNHGRPDSALGVYNHEQFGLNLRMTDIASAIGRVQLNKLEMMNEKRKKNAILLNQILSDCQQVIIPKVQPDHVHSWHQYTIRCKERESLINFLNSNEIESRIYYPSLIQSFPHLSNFSSPCPIAEKVSTEVVSLPVHPGLNPSEIRQLGQKVLEWADGASD